MINDTYWLTSAAKLFDPVARRIDAGEWELGEKAWPTLEVSFDPEARAAPRDRYWFHIDPEKHLPVAWSFQSRAGDGETVTYLWKQWQRIDKFLLPVRFELLGGDYEVAIENLYAPAKMSGLIFAEAITPAAEKEAP